jgi:hypothetical protein
MASQQSSFPRELLLQTLFRNRYFIISKIGAGGFNQAQPGSLYTSMVDVLVHKLERLIARMLEMDVQKRPPDIAYVKQELQEMSAIWSGICKSFWRPKLGYTQRARS